MKILNGIIQCTSLRQFLSYIFLFQGMKLLTKMLRENNNLVYTRPHTHFYGGRCFCDSKILEASFTVIRCLPSFTFMNHANPASGRKWISKARCVSSSLVFANGAEAWSGAGPLLQWLKLVQSHPWIFAGTNIHEHPEVSKNQEVTYNQL